jgi:hypothetical protein
MEMILQEEFPGFGEGVVHSDADHPLGHDAPHSPRREFFRRSVG